MTRFKSNRSKRLRTHVTWPCQRIFAVFYPTHNRIVYKVGGKRDEWMTAYFRCFYPTHNRIVYKVGGTRDEWMNESWKTCVCSPVLIREEGGVFLFLRHQSMHRVPKGWCKETINNTFTRKHPGGAPLGDLSKVPPPQGPTPWTID